MGGSPTLLMPVTPSYTASWASHTRRSPRSTEPGTDMFVPIGTPVYAPGDGVVYGSGNTIGPATGRWVGLDLDNGMRFRCMHLSRLVTLPRHVKRGALIGYSGASGYGYEDWSQRPGMPPAHTHVTLWPTHASRFGYDAQGHPFTIDFMKNVGGAASGESAAAQPEPESEEDDDMRNPAMFYITKNDLPASGSNPIDTYIITDTNGFYTAFSGVSGDYASGVAQQYGITVDAKLITRSHAQRIERDCALMRPGKS